MTDKINKKKINNKNKIYKIMIHTEKELELLKNNLSDMWSLVIKQLNKSKTAFFTNDKELAKEVKRREKRVDAFELKIDADCENYIVLYAPKAVDMRLVLSTIKISLTLERIADYANSIAKYVLKGERERLDEALLSEVEMEKIFDEAIMMLSNCFAAFDSEDVSASSKILSQDDEIDRIYYNSPDILAKHIQSKPDATKEILYLMIILKQLERIGDHCSNIIEDLVFYVDAKVLKHSGKKKK